MADVRSTYNCHGRSDSGIGGSPFRPVDPEGRAEDVDRRAALVPSHFGLALQRAVGETDLKKKIKHHTT